MRRYLTALTALVFAFSPIAGATIIDFGTYTSDTKLGLDYLDVGLVHGDYSFFGAGVLYGGRTWQLATAAQLASTWSDATGLALTPASVLSGDNDMGFAATKVLIDLFDGVQTDKGVGGERVIGDYSIAGYYNFISGGQLSVHSDWDDSHYQTGTDGYRSAWLVSSATVPEPATIFLLGTGLGVAGLAARRRRK